MLTRLLKNKKETYVATSKFWSYAKIHGIVDLFIRLMKNNVKATLFVW